MLQLIKNENMKIYRRLRTWIMSGILVLLAIVASIIYHDVLGEKGTFLEAIFDLSSLISIIVIFTVIIASDIVAGEFTWGTIKLLLIRPASRAKILLSKYVSSLMFAVLMSLILFITLFVVNGILYAFEGITGSLSFRDGSGWGWIFKYYVLSWISLLMVVTVSFMISTVFRSSSLAIGLSMVIYFSGSIIAGIFDRYAWSDYLIFKHLNLTAYLYDSSPMGEGMSLGFSLAVLAVYFIVCNAVSWFVFQKRDVAA